MTAKGAENQWLEDEPYLQGQFASFAIFVGTRTNITVSRTQLPDIYINCAEVLSNIYLWATEENRPLWRTSPWNTSPLWSIVTCGSFNGFFLDTSNWVWFFIDIKLTPPLKNVKPFSFCRSSWRPKGLNWLNHGVPRAQRTHILIPIKWEVNRSTSHRPDGF